jgi:uncharacterized protein
MIPHILLPPLSEWRAVPTDWATNFAARPHWFIVRITTMTHRSALVVTVLLALACGKRGDPRPPVPVIPQATSDVVVTQRADKVILSWSYPSLTTTGRSLTDIRRISVYRYSEELPESALDPATPVTPEPAVPREVTAFGRIPTLPRAQFEKLSTRIESIDKANLASVTAGAQLIFEDRPPLRSMAGRPVRLTYAVVTEASTARSELSNMVSLVPLPVSVPPSGLTATPQAEGVLLEWQRPEQSVGGEASPVVVGYHVYRSAPGEAPGELTPPVSVAPVTGTTYRDLPPYGEHDYRVSAVAATLPTVVQSEMSTPVRATFRDLVPPEAPTNVTALLETKLVRLLWDPVTAPDLAGYLLYRIEGPYRLKLSPEPFPQTSFTDVSIEVGTRYHYEVTAVDRSGNESAPARSEEVLVPRSP